MPYDFIGISLAYVFASAMPSVPYDLTQNLDFTLINFWALVCFLVPCNLSCGEMHRENETNGLAAWSQVWSFTFSKIMYPRYRKSSPLNDMEVIFVSWALPWNWSKDQCHKTDGWSINIDSGNGLVPLGTKLLQSLTCANVDQDPCRHMVSLSKWIDLGRLI